MGTVSILPAHSLGKNFIPQEFLADGKDEYYYREMQSVWPSSRWRHLRADEVERLVKNNNTADDWDDLLVTDHFNPRQISNSKFFGLVRIGVLRHITLEYHEQMVMTGITNSVIIACDIGDDVAIHNVRYLSHFIIGDRCILLNIDEMHTTNHAKFGNGILKQGESEQVRIWMDLMNESGCRKILPFNGMRPADAYLWAKYRDDAALLAQLKEITQNSFDSHRGYYGTVDSNCVIKNSRILKDVKVGAHCYIKGVNKLKNLTINSSEAEPTQIGEGVELVNGIIGYGCHIFYGCKAVRFILGDNSNLKYGARLINSFLGDNSTISCCEVLNNLIFPAHEQHHNNSFLIAAVVMGQSNVAAGATIGSNHNSRANDNEIQAGRGFWPGLCSSVKHSCRFASFVLLSKADYPAELNIPLPFSLLNNNPARDQLEVLPAYWWLYNMYALARNSWKFVNRDERKHKHQKIEFDFLAPDTIEEIMQACRLLERWTAQAWLRGRDEEKKTADARQYEKMGRALLTKSKNEIKTLEVLGQDMEKSNRKVLILKAYEAYHAYQDMLHFYAIKNLLAFLFAHPQENFASLGRALQGPRVKHWANLGGQLLPEKEVDKIRREIGAGKLASWEKIHDRYDRLWDKYQREKQKHAYAVWCEISGFKTPSAALWNEALGKALKIQEFIRDQVYISRKKDYDNPFRQSTFRNKEEMAATIGTPEENSFIILVQKETQDFQTCITEIKNRGN
jgi:hypothetical protein